MFLHRTSDVSLLFAQYFVLEKGRGDVFKTFSLLCRDVASMLLRRPHPIPTCCVNLSAVMILSAEQTSLLLFFWIYGETQIEKKDKFLERREFSDNFTTPRSAVDILSLPLLVKKRFSAVDHTLLRKAQEGK